MPVVSLLSLPDELLTRTSNYVASLSKWQLCALARTCRRLGRIAQAELFSDITVDSADELCALVIALQRRADLREKVVRLRIDFVQTIEVRQESFYDYAGSDDEYSPDPPRDCNIPLYECGISSLLGSAPFSALNHLELRNIPPSLLSALLRYAGSAYRLPGLQKIKLVGWDSPFADTNSSSNELWSLLSSFPSLVTIELRSPGLCLPSALDTTKQLSQVRVLHLGEVEAVDSAAMPLADLLPGLEHLEMQGSWGVEPLRHVVSTAASSLRTLALPELDENVPLSDFLGRFSQLEDMSFTGAWNLLPALPLLQQMQLRKLAFNDNAMEVSDELLLGLVSKLEHLRHLELNHMKAPISGKALEEQISDSLDWRDSETRKIYEQVRLDYGPQWTNTATRDGYAAALDVAKQRGINVTGDAVACVTWIDEYERQLEKCLIDYAVKSDGLTFLVDHYRAEHARDLLRRHRPAVRQLFLEA